MKMMKSLFNHKNVLRSVMVALTICWAIYAVLTFQTPANQAIGRYGLTYSQFSVIRVTFLVPYLFIWLTAGYAVARFHKYAQLLKGEPEGPSFGQITEGLLLLLMALIVPAFINLWAAFDPGDPDTQKLFTIFRNYINIILYLASFWLLYQGSKTIKAAIGTSQRANSSLRKYVHWFVGILGVAYIYSIYHNEFRTMSQDPQINSTYHLPDALILLTIVAPYILIWLWGLVSIVNYKEFSKNVEGVVYKKAFSNTSNGLVFIISLSISLQFLSQLPGFFGHSSLSIILGIVYLILLLMALGYYFIARGVRALTAIEET
jgi:hypothetical protein